MKESLIKRRQMIFILILFFGLSLPVFAGLISISAESALSQKVIHYRVHYNIHVALRKIIRWIFGFKFLDWKELILEEEMAKGGEREKIAAIKVYPKDLSEPIMYLRADGKTVEGFARPLKTKTKFLKESVEQLLSAFNNLIYDDCEQDFEINLPNIFEDLEESQKNRGSMYCRFIKKKDSASGKYLIQVLTFNAEKKENSKIEIWLDPKTKEFESLDAKLKIGPKITLIKIPQSAK